MRHENERDISGVGASPPAGESPTVVARILGVLANLAAWDAKALCEQVVEALIDLAYRPDLLHSFVKAAGVPIAA
jgi:hypothetical protein